MRVEDIELFLKAVAGESVSLMFKRFAEQSKGTETERIAHALETFEKIFGLGTLVPILKLAGKKVIINHTIEKYEDKIKVNCPFKELLITKNPWNIPFVIYVGVVFIHTWTLTLREKRKTSVSLNCTQKRSV
ncbi:hypothetical protein [Hydrogenobacter thermophilus]|uniref:hypothetical protein n=1 Tax=Hydrogenobacter thermophilus TaxID=940 RepID=UPI0030F5A69C